MRGCDGRHIRANACSVPWAREHAAIGARGARRRGSALREREELEARLVEIERAVGALEAERARRVAEVARRGSCAWDGHLSPISWLARRLRAATQAAARYLGWAKALERLPGTRRALAEGEITLSAAAVLVGAAEAHPEHIGGLPLLEAARTLTVRDLQRAVAYRRQLVDARPWTARWCRPDPC